MSSGRGICRESWKFKSVTVFKSTSNALSNTVWSKILGHSAERVGLVGDSKQVRHYTDELPLFIGRFFAIAQNDKVSKAMAWLLLLDPTLLNLPE
ncbi:MAG: hypothetical protein K2Y22_15680 [Candidatus Obscuribacterales bacterium]|nr:hypothetical protein [Candidatus Obscuribacterales bacterium]